MLEKYHVEYDGPRTRIIETPAGEWPRWNQARHAAIEAVEEILAEAQATLDVLRRSGNYFEYGLRQAVSDSGKESHDGRLVILGDAEDFLKGGRFPADECK